MIKMPDNMSLDDFHQWLGNGYFFYNPSSGENYKIGRLIAGPEEEDGEFLVMDIKGREERIEGPIQDFVFPHWPMCGAVNLVHTKCAVIVRRLQKQQYRRTYNAKCVDLKIPRKWDLMKAREKEINEIDPSDPSTVHDIFFPTYFELSDLEEKWNEGWFSVAVNPYILIVNNPDDAPLVYYRGDFVGTLKDGNVFDPVDRGAARRIAKHLHGDVIVS